MKHHQHRHVRLQVLRCHLFHRRCARRRHRSVLLFFVLPRRLTHGLDRSAKHSPDAGGLSARQLLEGVDGTLGDVIGGFGARQIVPCRIDDIGDADKNATGAISRREYCGSDEPVGDINLGDQGWGR